MRILFITSSRIGDAVLSTGLLDHLLRRYPAARITIACGRLAEGVFARVPRCERLIVMHKQPNGMHWFHLWREVAFTVWDLVVDLRGSALSWFVPAKKRVIKHGGRRPGHRLLHIAQVLDVVPAPRPVAWFGPEDVAEVEAALPGDRPVLVLGVTASKPYKVWSGDRFAAAARAITAPDGPLPGARIVVLGGPGEGERRMAAPVLEALPEAVPMLGRLSMPGVTAMLARAALFLGNDSGLTHLAAATGAPTVGLFGPTLASEYAPIGPRAVIALADGPAGEAPMEALPVERVVETARGLLEGRLHPEALPEKLAA